jgi:penicillin-insensitive murein endopeptidase
MAVDPARWTARHATLIRIAAEAPGVDRLLVNPAIKLRLCQDHPGQAWLRRVRPWRGHDSHMHIRLRCPEGSPECRDIAPPPPGDGCDASLDWWFSPESRQPAPRRPGPPGPPPRLPLACAGVLSAPAR